MTDTSLGGTSTKTIEDAYLAHRGTKRMLSTILFILFIAMMVAGFRTADARNAGGFFDGFTSILDFPGDVIGEAIERSHLLPGYLCLLYTSPSPRDLSTSRMPSSA